MNSETLIRTLDSDRSRMLAYGWSILRDHHAAEDILQDLLVVAIKRVEQFTDPDHLLKWSQVTLRNNALEYLRKKKTRATCALSDDVLEKLTPHWDRQAGGTDDSEIALRKCLTTLTPQARQLIELRYGKGLRGTDVAQATNRRPHTVYVALGRAYKLLASCIETRLQEAQAND